MQDLGTPAVIGEIGERVSYPMSSAMLPQMLSNALVLPSGLFVWETDIGQGVAGIPGRQVSTLCDTQKSMTLLSKSTAGNVLDVAKLPQLLGTHLCGGCSAGVGSMVVASSQRLATRK